MRSFLAFLLLIVPLAALRAAEPDRTPGTLGIQIGEVTTEDAERLKWDEPTGVKVVRAEPGSPAEKAGLKPGEIILSVDGVELSDAKAFTDAISAKGAGAQVKLRVFSGGGGRTVTATLVAHVATKAVDALNTLSPLNLMLDTGGHQALIKGLAWTRDGKEIVSGGDDKVIRVWDTETGKTLRTIRGEIGPGPEGKIFAIALSPDKRLLAVGGFMAPGFGVKDDHVGDVRIYDYATGKLLRLLTGHGNVIDGLAFSPDGKRLISGGDDAQAIIWNPETGEELHRLRGHSEPIYAVGFTSDGKNAVTGSDDHTLKLWSVETGKLIETMEGHSSQVEALAANPKSPVIISGGNDGELRLWDGKTGKLIKLFGKSGSWVGSLAVSPDGSKLVSTCGGGPPCAAEPQIVWDLATGKRLSEAKLHDNIVITSAFSPDGRWIATGGGADQEIRIWAPGLSTEEATPKTGPNGNPLLLRGTGGTVWAVSISKDGKTIAWGNTNFNPAGTVPVNERGPLEVALRLPGPGERLGQPFPAPKDATPTVTGGGGGNSGLENGGASKAPPPPPAKVEKTRAGDGPSDAPIAWGKAVIDYKGYTLRHRKGGNYGGSAFLELSLDGKLIASLERDGTTGYDHRAYTFTPDGKTIVTGGANGVVQAFDLAEIVKAAEDEDGHVIRGAQLRKLAKPFVGHQGDVWAVMVSPDGKMVATGSSDQTLKLWNLERGELIASIFRSSSGQWVAWVPQGYFTGSEDAGDIVGWQLNQGSDHEARYITGGQLRKQFERPDIVAKAIELGSSEEAIREAIHTDFKLDDLLARPVPKVRILSPLIDARLSGDDSRLEFEVDGPATSWRALVNGVRVGGGTLRAKRTDIPLPLAQGDNLIEVVVVNADNVESNLMEGGRIRVVHQGKGSLDKRGTLHIIAIGVDKYPGLGDVCKGRDGKPKSCDLTYASDDAKALAEMLVKRLGPTHDRVAPLRILINAPGFQAPTRANILDALSEVHDTAEPNDTIALFAAGHGQDLDGGYLFMPTDAQWQSGRVRLSSVLDWTEMQKLVATTNGRRLMFLDTCHCGNAPNSVVASEARNEDIVAFLATGASQASLEKGPPIGHGIFTYALIEGL